jgi:HSP90 family molecular chaperone
MPITSELQNVRELKEVGFTDRQAEKLAEMHERSQTQGFEKFVEVLERGLGDLRNEMKLEMKLMEARLDARIEGLRLEMHQTLNVMLQAQNAMLLKIFGMFVGVISLAVAIIKLFPNLR